MINNVLIAGTLMAFVAATFSAGYLATYLLLDRMTIRSLLAAWVVITLMIIIMARLLSTWVRSTAHIDFWQEMPSGDQVANSDTRA